VRPAARREFPLSPRPIVGFSGPFGSGKTEVAIGYALAALAHGRATCIIDLDIVTPYFRLGDHREHLGAQGLRVIAPEGARARFETPSLPPEIAGALAEEDLHVVLDVGGDAAGALLLGTYAGRVAARGYDLWMVVNPFRAWSQCPKALAQQAREIEASSQLRITGLIADPHLGRSTEPAHLRAGLEKVRQAAEVLDQPLVGMAVERSLVREASPLGLPILPLQLLLRPPWEGE